MPDILFDRAAAVLTKVLDGTAVRQRALANNIANAETPGYHRQEVDFASRLDELITQPTVGADRNQRAIEALPITLVEDTAAPVQPNGNTVSLEREMTEVARNSLQYETAVQMLKMKFAELRTAINGR